MKHSKQEIDLNGEKITVYHIDPEFTKEELAEIKEELLFNRSAPKTERVFPFTLSKDDD